MLYRVCKLECQPIALFEINMTILINLYYLTLNGIREFQDGGHIKFKI
jgi:hypothetical protein